MKISEMMSRLAIVLSERGDVELGFRFFEDEIVPTGELDYEYEDWSNIVHMDFMGMGSHDPSDEPDKCLIYFDGRTRIKQEDGSWRTK